MKKKGATKSFLDRREIVRDKSLDYKRTTTNDSWKRKYRGIVKMDLDGSYEIQIPNKIKTKDLIGLVVDTLCDMNFLLLQDDRKIAEWNAFKKKHDKAIDEMKELKERFNELKKDERDYQEHIEAMDDFLDKMNLDFDEYSEKIKNGDSHEEN